MVLNIKTLLVVAVFIAVTVVGVGTAFAKVDAEGTRPGWGYGDNNHVHTGPPGQSVRPAK